MLHLDLIAGQGLGHPPDTMRHEIVHLQVD